MPVGEGFRPFQAQGIKIPIENVGVRLSGRRPGERRLHLVRPAMPEQPRTLLLEMQQYITTRQSLREQGYFVAAGKEPRIDIPRADAIYNDLDYLLFTNSSELSVTARQINDRVNPRNIQHIFEVYAIGQMSPEKQRDVLEMNDRLAARHRKLRRERPYEVKGLRSLTHEELETVGWLLESVGVPFEVLEGATAIPFAELFMEARRRATI